MSDPSARTFSSDFKRFFLRGLVVLLPTILTLWIVVKAYQFVDGAIAEPINGGVRLFLANATPYSDALHEQFAPTEAQIEAARAAARQASVAQPSDSTLRNRLLAENISAWWASRWYMDFIGLALAIIAVYITGHLLGGFLGRKIYRRVERLITSLPIFKQVYPYVKQFVDFLLGEDKQIKFSSVVMVQYPRKGVWSIGFQTGSAMRAMSEKVGDSVVVFIPWTPTPFTGYAITVARSEIVELPITIEEALRFVVSGGVLIPERQAAGPGAPPMAATSEAPSDHELERADESELAARAAKAVKALNSRNESSVSTVQPTRSDRPEASLP